MLVLNGTLGTTKTFYFALLHIYFKYRSGIFLSYTLLYGNSRGFPVWLKYVPGISFRTDNGPFKVCTSHCNLCMSYFHNVLAFSIGTNYGLLMVS